MPAKNSIKIYQENSYYHMYNRGVEKRQIYCDEQDYSVFLSYLKEYLEPKDIIGLSTILFDTRASYSEKDKVRRLLRLNNFSDTLSLCAYCLMPNHFHLLVHQREERTIDTFMNSLSTRYTVYFNKKYKRVGSLFQGVYKAVKISSEEQLLYVSKYIHRNPTILPGWGEDIRLYPYSSFSVYGNRKTQSWIHSENILSFFSEKFGIKNSYSSFVLNTEVSDEESLSLCLTAIDE